MKKAFTLIELLVIISIIAVLVALLLPAVSRAKSVGQKATCINNQKQLQMAHTCLLYTSPSPRDLSTSRMPSSA